MPADGKITAPPDTRTQDDTEQVRTFIEDWNVPVSAEPVLAALARLVAERDAAAEALTRSERERKFQGDRAAIYSSAIGLARLCLQRGENAKAAEYLADGANQAAALLEDALAALGVGAQHDDEAQP